MYSNGLLSVYVHTGIGGLLGALTSMDLHWHQSSLNYRWAWQFYNETNGVIYIRSNKYVRDSYHLGDDILKAEPMMHHAVQVRVPKWRGRSVRKRNNMYDKTNKWILVQLFTVYVTASCKRCMVTGFQMHYRCDIIANQHSRNSIFGVYSNQTFVSVLWKMEHD